MKKNNKRKGFTIVELVIVIAVIAILAAVLIPTYNNVVESAKKTAALEEAKNTLTSYNAYMLTQTEGTGLSEGAVFYNPNYGYYYAYIASSIKEITDMEVVGSTVPLANVATWTQAITQIGDTKGLTFATNKILYTPYISIDGVSYACDTIAVCKVNKDYYVFAFKNNLEVEFSDGSSQCKIFAGRILGIYTDLKSDWTYGSNEAAYSVSFTGTAAYSVHPVGDQYTAVTASDIALTSGYSCSITATSGTIGAVTVTAGGDALTAQQYTWSNNILTITAGIDGPIVITVPAGA